MASKVRSVGAVLVGLLHCIMLAAKIRMK